MIFVLLIPRYGGLGAAYGLVAGYASASILLIIISNKLYYLPYKINRLISAYIIIFSIIIFYNAISTGKNREWLQQSSLDTWILMEACNESARRNEKININEFKKYLTGE